MYKIEYQAKFKEALRAVLPIIAIVLGLCFTVVSASPSILMAFLMGAVLLTIGMTFFTLGAELAMTPMGERVGSHMTKTKKLWIMIILSFLLGFIITISEPDLQVLANQGVASGPMTATFLLPFAMGACVSVGGNIVEDAFGVVAMVAMTPLITIQIMGLLYKFKDQKRKTAATIIPSHTAFDILDDYDIIDI